MPFYEYQCKGCKNIVEALVEMGKGDLWMDDHECAICDADGRRKQHGWSRLISAPARTVTLWGDETGKYGVNGMYSSALGRRVTNKREEEAICRKMGYVNANDLPQGFVDNKIQSQLAEDQHFENLNSAYKKKVKEYGSTYGGTMKAICEVLPAKEMLKQSDEREAKT
jgi:hypothetical protein